jgi:hypothetical protein
MVITTSLHGVCMVEMKVASSLDSDGSWFAAPISRWDCHLSAQIYPNLCWPFIYGVWEEGDPSQGNTNWLSGLLLGWAGWSNMV